MRPPNIVLLILLTTLIRLAFAASTGLGVDESYMIAAGRSFAIGYFDHPPAAWWLSHGAALLFGTEAPIVVRLPFILLFAVSQALLYAITSRIAGRTAAIWAVLALNLSPVFGLTTGTWVLPDGPLDAALLAAALSFLKATSPQNQQQYETSWPGSTGPSPTTGASTHQTTQWLLTGLFAGLALLSKYSAVLTIAGAFLGLLATPTARRNLRTPGPYLAALAAAATFSPVLIWNATHHWASFAFQGDRALGFRFHPLAPLTVLGGEALFVLPWIWLPMMLLLFRALRRNAPEQHRLLAWLALPPIALFALIALWSSQRILFHWAAPGYLMLFPLLGQAIAEHANTPWVRRTTTATAALLLASMLVIATQIQTGWLSPLLTRLPKDPTAEGLNWTSIRTDLAARGLLKPDTIAAAFNWRDAGKFGTALGPEVTMLCLSPDAREFGFARPPEAYSGQDVLLLAVNPALHAMEEAQRWFQSVQQLPAIEIRLGNRNLEGVTILLGKNLQKAPHP
jgi:4-amino-4-deoxy-L-arabinose transferase-like glycosyltransferase